MRPTGLSNGSQRRRCFRVFEPELVAWEATVLPD